MSIPLHSPTIYRNEMEAVLTRMVEEEVGPGDTNKELANKVSQYFSGSYTVAFRSPSIALSYAFSCLGVQSGSSIIISPLAPFWMYVELQKHNITPILVDTKHDDIFMDLSEIKEKIASYVQDMIQNETSNNYAKIKAIILSEALGFMPEM